MNRKRVLPARVRQRSIAHILALVLAVGSLPLMAGCGKSDLHKLHDSLNAAAKSLNAAAKTNRQFYESGIYGVVGSPRAVELRQKGAKVIHDSNEHLITALTLARGLTEATFEQGKLAVLQNLAQAATGLTTGHQTIDLVLATVATLINQAVAIITLFKSSHLRFVLPEIKTWKIAEVNV